jgi:nicotinamide mononucleotide transporter
MTIIEGIAAISGLICVWLTIKQKILCWPIGLVQILLYIYVFYCTRLYSDVILQVIFVFISIYGWYYWKKGNPGKEKVPVSLAGLFTGVWFLISLGGTFAMGFLMSKYTNAALPYPDSFVTVASLIAQWLMAKKKLESWFFWIIVDIIATGIYWYKNLYFTSGLYTVFLILAILGYLEWRKSFKNTKAITQTAR